MSAAEAFNDLGDLYDGFYDHGRKSGSTPQSGQIVFCPVLETDRRLRIGDVARIDSYAHTQVTMNIRDQEGHDFRGKEDRLPIKGLSLDASHELVIARAKLRPCLVIACCVGIDPSSIPSGPQRNYASKGFYPVYLLAPIFHISRADQPSAFGPILAARIKCLMYPDFFYLRESGGILRVPSIARLDRMFLQAPHPGLGFTLEELFVKAEIFGVALAQVKYLLGQDMSKEHRDLRDLMLTCLPESAALAKTLGDTKGIRAS